MVDWLKQMQKYYCDHDSLFAVLNAPLAFRAIFAVVKVILTKRQTGKFKLLGDTSKPDVQKALSELFPEATGACPLATPEEINVQPPLGRTSANGDGR
mmetsp:Transcript_66986/g.155474  ORF Transcript_66986/g.155474 Transcript_66986/m.155474 type:complete len:98 (+) Transcript_66986:315-608(+)